MAEIQSQQLLQKHGGVPRCKKQTTRIDLTPMVDLGFLLITFFVFTTSLSKARAMKIALPDESNIIDHIPVSDNKVLTLVLADENTIGYYFGDKAEKMMFTGYGTEGVRSVILEKQAAVTKLYGDQQQMMVLIKPTDNSTYKNLVETLDEMLINNVKSYMLLDVNAAEQLQVSLRK